MFLLGTPLLLSRVENMLLRGEVYKTFEQRTAFVPKPLLGQWALALPLPLKLPLYSPACTLYNGGESKVSRKANYA